MENLFLFHLIFYNNSIKNSLMFPALDNLSEILIILVRNLYQSYFCKNKIN